MAFNRKVNFLLILIVLSPLSHSRMNLRRNVIISQLIRISTLTHPERKGSEWVIRKTFIGDEININKNFYSVWCFFFFFLPLHSPPGMLLTTRGATQFNLDIFHSFPVLIQYFAIRLIRIHVRIRTSSFLQSYIQASKREQVLRIIFSLSFTPYLAHPHSHTCFFLSSLNHVKSNL